MPVLLLDNSFDAFALYRGSHTRKNFEDPKRELSGTDQRKPDSLGVRRRHIRRGGWRPRVPDSSPRLFWRFPEPDGILPGYSAPRPSRCCPIPDSQAHRPGNTPEETSVELPPGPDPAGPGS